MPIILLDSATKSANITLTNGSLTATCTAATASAVRANLYTVGNALPLRIFEVTVDNFLGGGAVTPIIGVVPLSNYTSTVTVPLNSTTLRPTAGGFWAVYKYTTLTYTSSVPVANGDVVAVRYSNVSGNYTCDFYVNGTLIYDGVPTTTPVTSPVMYLSLGLVNEAVTVNFGDHPFTTPLPADTVQWQNDKQHAIRTPVIRNRPYRHLGL